MSDSGTESGLALTNDSAQPVRLAERTSAAEQSADWPAALQHAMKLCLSCAAPAALLHGEDFCFFYNAGLRGLLGAQHLGAVGLPLSVCSPQLARALSAHLARAARGESQLLSGLALAGLPGRDGYLQIDASLTPVTDEHGRVAGIALHAFGRNALIPAEAPVQEELRCTQLLCDVGAKLAHERELTTLYRDILDTAIALTHADAGTVQILNQERDALEILATKGFSPHVTEHFRWVSARSATSCGAALRAGARTYVDFDDPAFADLLDMRLHTGDGYFAAQSTPLVTRAGRPIGMVSTHWRERHHRPNERELRYLDLLARQTADLLERRQSEIALKEADRRKDIFLATLAHELRNPLAPIAAGLEVLRCGAATSPDGIHQMIARQVSHMVRLIDDLLELSRISSGKIRLRREVVALEQLVDGALEGNRGELEAGRFALTLDLPAGVFLDVDPTRFIQVLSNLVQNAIKFTQAQGRIAISGTLSHGELTLSVQDSGAGIAAAMLPRIFEPFIQEHPGAEQAGLGLGLPLARQLIELHGGTIEASSAGENRGSCFSIRIPAVAGGNSAARPPAQQADVIAGRHILIIDDNVDAANSMALLLRHFGASTEVAHDGPTGLRLAEQLRPEAVLLDIGMPGMDGFETCQHLRKLLGEAVRIVALTGWGQQRDREATALAGCDEHLTKPATIADLQRALRAGKRD